MLLVSMSGYSSTLEIQSSNTIVSSAEILFILSILFESFASLLFFLYAHAVDDGRDDRFGKGSGHAFDGGVLFVKE